MQQLEPIVTQLENSMVKIEVDGEIGWVSSWHLVEPKVIQLREAARRNGNVQAWSRRRCNLHRLV